jgi:hypothetical protein
MTGITTYLTRFWTAEWRTVPQNWWLSTLTSVCLHHYIDTINHSIRSVVVTRWHVWSLEPLRQNRNQKVGHIARPDLNHPFGILRCSTFLWSGWRQILRTTDCGFDSFCGLFEAHLQTMEPQAFATSLSSAFLDDSWVKFSISPELLANVPRRNPDAHKFSRWPCNEYTLYCISYEEMVMMTIQSRKMGPSPHYWSIAGTNFYKLAHSLKWLTDSL